MKNKKIPLFLSLIFLYLFLVTPSFPQEKSTLKRIGLLEKIIISKEQTTLDVKIILNFYTYTHHFTLSNPNRLVIDFHDIKDIKTSRYFEVNHLGVLALRNGMFKSNIARVVFDFEEQIPPYKINRIQGGLRIFFALKEVPEIREEKPEIKKELPKIKPEIKKEIPVKEKIQIEDAICDMKVEPAKANLNDPISVDMSGSQHAKNMEIDVFNSEGIKITSKKLTVDSPKWEIRFNKPGEYVFDGKAFNIQEKSSENLCETKIYINSPPTCKLESLHKETYVGMPFTSDVSSFSDPDGKVIKAEFWAADEARNSVDYFSDTEKPFSWETVFKKEGNYSILAIVTDDWGGVSKPAVIKVAVKPKKAFILVDGGSLVTKGSPYVGYAVGRVGLLYKIISPTLDFALIGGGGATTAGDPWKSFFMANVLFNVHVGPVFLGVGAGITTRIKTTRNSDSEVVANVGFDVFNNNMTIGSIFFEGRGAIGKGRSFSKHHKLMLSLRFLF